MSKSIQQIKQDLLGFETVVSALAIELQDLYRKYLNLLSKSAEKQLVLVTYQICTQEYPQSFLKLSLQSRENLQQNIRKLGKQIGTICLQEELTSDSETTKEADLSIDSLLAENEDSSAEKSQMRSHKPEYWIEWHQQIQRTINETFESISKQANLLLKEAEILPHQLPEKIMDMAIAAENTDSPIGGYPNMLNMLIEAEENESETSDPKITKLTAIRLRLPEIEFSDPNLSAIGNQIRNLLAKIDKIRKQYHKKERQLLRAEAESSWRSTWYEE